MNSNEIYKNYLEALRERAELENKIENFIERWKNGDTTISNDTVQQTVDKGYQRLEELRKVEAKLHAEYMQQEQMEESKKNADISVQHNLGVRPTQYETNLGVLSSKASESHLIATEKSPEQIEQEKNQLLNTIKARVQSGEITLSEASKLVNDVNISYGFYVQDSEEKQSGMRR